VDGTLRKEGGRGEVFLPRLAPPMILSTTRINTDTTPSKKPLTLERVFDRFRMSDELIKHPRAGGEDDN